MDTETRNELHELRKLMADLVRTLAATLRSPVPKLKPKPASRPAVAPRELTELERIQRNFAFLREHGGVMAEGHYDRATGEIQWVAPPGMPL